MNEAQRAVPPHQTDQCVPVSITETDQDQIEVNWADKRFRLISHVKAKMDDCGAIRNLLVGSAVAQGITAEQVREDMDHIHKLTIVDMPFQTATPMLTRALRAMLFTPDPAY